MQNRFKSIVRLSHLAVFSLLLLATCGSNIHSEWIPDGYSLVWADEFDYNGGPDPAKWAFESGFIRNNEAQYYTEELKNARVENGTLIIETHKESVPNKAFVSEDERSWRLNQPNAQYTAASLTTIDLADWQYGIIEVKAKLPRGVGMWPAIWMLGRNWHEAGWPVCGEIDIMEHVGYDPETIHGTIHTGAYNHRIGTQKGGTVSVDDPYDSFHYYAVEWNSEKIDFLLDGVVYYSVANEHKTEAEWPFDQPFHLKLNIAVGGGWGGQQGIDDAVFPQQMIVDYVRVYQKQ